MVEPATALDSGLTTFEWLSVIAVIVGVLLTGMGILVVKLYSNLMAYVGAVHADLKTHIQSDQEQQRVLNRFMGAISQKLKIPIPSE